MSEASKKQDPLLQQSKPERGELWRPFSDPALPLQGHHSPLVVLPVQHSVCTLVHLCLCAGLASPFS